MPLLFSCCTKEVASLSRHPSVYTLLQRLFLLSVFKGYTIDLVDPTTNISNDSTLELRSEVKPYHGQIFSPSTMKFVQLFI